MRTRASDVFAFLSGPRSSPLKFFLWTRISPVSLFPGGTKSHDLALVADGVQGEKLA